MSRFSDQRYGPDRSICWESTVEAPSQCGWLKYPGCPSPGPTWEPSRLPSQDDTITTHFQVSIWFIHYIGRVSNRASLNFKKHMKFKLLWRLWQITTTARTWELVLVRLWRVSYFRSPPISPFEVYWHLRLLIKFVGKAHLFLSFIESEIRRICKFLNSFVCSTVHEIELGA